MIETLAAKSTVLRLRWGAFAIRRKVLTVSTRVRYHDRKLKRQAKQNAALTAAEIRRRLRAMANPEQAAVLQRFFKTGPGQYGEGDVFIGVKVPRLRALVRECHSLPLEGAVDLLHSPVHEERMLALLLLVRRYERSEDEAERQAVFDVYLANTARINNWDLVDVTVAQIVGAHLEHRDRSVLYALSRSKSIWERRIAIMATFFFIRRGDFEDTLRIADLLLQDKEDLIHKATGWMLREIGNRDLDAEEAFLKTRYRKMPRTMLRYAIEKFEESRRQQYLRGRIDPS